MRIRGNSGEACVCAGNGLTDPAVQYGAYGDFAYENGLINKNVHDRIAAAYPTCKYLIDQCNGHDWALTCKAALAYCEVAVFGQVMEAAGNINVYDIRKQCNFPLCYDFSRLEKYIAQDSVRKALGVGDRHWSICDKTVHAHMMGDWMIDVRLSPVSVRICHSSSL
jgi:carboxypeptidase C (cathepsin A)